MSGVLADSVNAPRVTTWFSFREFLPAIAPYQPPNSDNQHESPPNNYEGNYEVLHFLPHCVTFLGANRLNLKGECSSLKSPE